jgi:hypothetical protein
MVDIFPEAFESQRDLAFRTGDGLDVVVSTGYALFGMRGNDDQTWNRQDLIFRVGPQWEGFPDSVAVVSPSSMYNKNTAVNAGWAVDRVDLTYYSVDPGGPPGVQVSLSCGVAVSDKDGILYRVSYQVTTVGRLV